MADLSSFTFLVQMAGAIVACSGGFLCLRWWVFWRGNYRGGLLTIGPYARVRHPLYSAFIILVVGLAISFPVYETVMLALLSMAVIVIHVRKEEEWLLARYGNAYREYAKRVRWRLIPSIY